MNSFKLNKTLDNPIRKSKIENSQSGIAIVTVMIMISLLVVVGITMNRRSGIKSSGSPNHLKKHEAIYIAEAGVQHTIYELMIDPIKRGSIFTGEIFGSGSYSTEAWQPEGALGDIIIKSTGEISEGNTLIARKTIQMRMMLRGETIVFRSEAADTYIESSRPSKNYGDGTSLFIGKSQDNYYRGLLKFDLSEIPPGGLDTLGAYGAYIELYMDNYVGSGIPIIDMHRVTQSWVEGPGGRMGPDDGVTWNTYDGKNPWNTPGGDYTARVEGFSILKEESRVWYRWTLPDLSLIQGWVDDPDSNFGIIMKDSSEDKWVVADAVKFRYVCGNTIIDDTDSDFFSYTGTWNRTSSSSAYGSGMWKYYYYHYTGDGTDTATWTANLQCGAGDYNVYVWYPSDSSFATDAQFTINTAAGSFTKTVNQGVNGGQWVSFGTYPFANDNTEYVTLSDKFTPFRVAADAVRYQPSTTFEVIVDDADTGFSYTGTWNRTSSRSAYGSGRWKYYYYHDAGNGTDTAIWTADLPCGAGDYNVYVWYPSSSSFATDAQFTVNGSPVIVDQSTGGGTWYSLGTYSLGTTVSVTLLDSTTGRVAADAVKFVNSFQTNGIVDNLDTDFFNVAGTWGTSTGSGNYGSDYYYHAKGTGANTATWNADLRCGAGSYNVDVWYPVDPLLARDAQYTIYQSGSTTTKTVNQTVDGGNWYSLGTYAFADDGTEKITLSDEFTPARVAADAVKFEPTFIPERIVDNSDPGFSRTEGTWNISTGYPNYYDLDFRYNEPGTGPGTVTWEADLILGDGSYEVFVWYPESTGFTTNAPYTVHYTSWNGSSSTTALVDQSKNGGQWFKIGTYTFNDDSTEKVTLNVDVLYGEFLSSESDDINLWPKLVILTR